MLQIHDLPKPAYLNRSIGDLGIGTFDNIEVSLRGKNAIPKSNAICFLEFEFQLFLIRISFQTARQETPIIEALNKFVTKRISALPIVDDEGKLVDIYAKFDVIVSFPHIYFLFQIDHLNIFFFSQNLAAEKTYNNLDVSLKEANEHRNEWFEGVYTCKKTDSLFKVMEIIVKAEVLHFPEKHF